MLDLHDRIFPGKGKTEIHSAIFPRTKALNAKPQFFLKQIAYKILEI